MPCSMAFLPASSAAIWAAKGVDLREPLNPMVPEEDQASVLPCASVIVIMVLLKDAFTCATPEVMFFFSLRRTFVRAWACSFAISSKLQVPVGGWKAIPGGARAPPRNRPPQVAFFLPAIGFAGPLRVRALVCVRWPRTGRPLRCRRPR